MSNDKYTINAEIVESIDYEILVIGRPDSELEDLLTNLVEERGRIAKSRYEDFLIANCIANLNQFMAHITTVASGISEDFNLMKVREEALTLILKHNKALEPSNVVINRNKVLKLKTDDNLKDCQLLEDNPHWGQSFYDEYGNYTPVSKKASYENVYQRRTGEKQVDTRSEEIEKISSVSELPYEEKRVWWERFGEYIIIRKYSEDDVNKILTFRYFHNSTSFNTFIVSNCVKSIEDIYERIDGMGITIDPKKIISDLYKLCITVNPNLTFTKFKELRGSSEEDGANDVNLTKSSQAPQPSVGFGNKLKKDEGPRFRDVSKKELLSLANSMKLSLIGQDGAIDTVTEAIKRASVGLKNPDKPIGSFLFAGSTGCGKTLTTKVLANELIKTRKNRIVIDCSEYIADNEYTKLIGAPPEYLGHDSGGVLTDAVAENPFSVVVFDEIEKANTKIFDLMLQILDEGRLTDGKGKSVSFKDTVIIMTSNVGVKEISSVGKTIGFGDVAVITEDKKKGALKAALRSKFKPEFLNRLDSIVYFKDLTKDDYKKIIELELEKLNENLKSNDTDYKDITLTFDKKIKTFIYNKGVDSEYGARPITRAIEKYIANDVAALLLEDQVALDAEIKVTTLRGRVDLKVEQNEEPNILIHSEVAN